MCKFCGKERKGGACGLCNTCYTKLRRGNIYFKDGYHEFKPSKVIKDIFLDSKSIDEFLENSGCSEEEFERYYRKFNHLKYK